MTRIIRMLALACILAGAALLAGPSTARATLDPTLINEQPGEGVRYCCSSTDKTKSCCFPTGCYVNSSGCFQLR